MSEELRQIAKTIEGHMNHLRDRLQHRAGEIGEAGGDPEVVSKLMQGADALNDSAHIYLSWATHYVSISEKGTCELEEDDGGSLDIG